MCKDVGPCLMTWIKRRKRVVPPEGNLRPITGSGGKSKPNRHNQQVLTPAPSLRHCHQGEAAGTGPGPWEAHRSWNSWGEGGKLGKWFSNFSYNTLTKGSFARKTDFCSLRPEIWIQQTWDMRSRILTAPPKWLSCRWRPVFQKTWVFILESY